MKIDRATKQLLRDPRKRHAWIKYQLILQDRSMADVAREEGVVRQCLYQVFRNPYPRMEKALANALGMTPPELWPERYDADGLPLARGRGRPPKKVTKSNNNTPRRGRNVKRGRPNEQRKAA